MPQPRLSFSDGVAYSWLMAFGPYDAGSRFIGRAVELVDASRSVPDLRESIRSDMRRLSIVMAVGAIDTYMHRLVLDRAYTHGELPGALARLGVPFEWLLAQADQTKLAARSKPRRSRPRVAVKRQLRDRLLRETFQRYEEVSGALGMAGRSGNWEAIGQQMTPPMTPDQIGARLNEIVTRRNQIVHEGDYRRLERPRDSARNAVSYTQARRDIEFISALIDAIHAVV